ncbi:MAG: DoxX family protein [Nanoarchaeota archaeon]
MNTIFFWILRLIPAIILLQTLFFKFTGAPEAVFIFTQIGVEPWGRYALGVLELLVSISFLVRRWVAVGAFLGVVMMIGALLAHFTFLGIDVQGDHGLLFGMAWIVLMSCAILLYTQRKELPLVKL